MGYGNTQRRSGTPLSSSKNKAKKGARRADPLAGSGSEVRSDNYPVARRPNKASKGTPSPLADPPRGYVHNDRVRGVPTTDVSAAKNRRGSMKFVEGGD